MDGKDKQILDMIKGNARMSYQEIGDALGMTRVAAKKRIDKLEKAGIIRGYNTWMKNPKSAMISCNDGFRPVSFLIETMDEDSD